MVDIIPKNYLVDSMEGMGAVLMDMDPGDTFGIDISGDVVPAVNDQAAFVPPVNSLANTVPYSPAPTIK